MKKIHGNIDGLKADQKRRIENLYRRRESSEFTITPELCHEITKLSF
jgi:GTP-binding protein HflX